jgi:YD repeat-containing protein
VQQPANSGTSTTAYAGNTVTITDPAGRWKKYTSDALGNLTQVTEPNPQGGAPYETYYTYNAAGQMTQVSMPRPNVGWAGTTTQTRTFVYNQFTGFLTSTTNPENGTTQYFYTANGLLDYKLDAKGQKVKFTYDAYERVTKLEPFVNTSATEPIACEVVNSAGGPLPLARRSRRGGGRYRAPLGRSRLRRVRARQQVTLRRRSVLRCSRA